MILNSIFLFLAGLLSGIINVVSGGGSFITLPVLSMYGLSPSVANGTNRIAILLQNISAVGNFTKEKVVDFKRALFLSIPTTLGAVVGTSIVLKLPDEIIKKSLGIIFLGMAFFMIHSPKVWEEGRKTHKRPLLSFLVFFLIGVYGGYIQAGVGFFLIYALTLLEGFDIVRTNALKVLLVLLFTILSLILFTFGNKIEPVPGLILGAGSFFGGYLGSKLAIKLNKRYIRYFVITMMIVSAISYLI